MELFPAYLLLMLVASLILIALYVFTLVHNFMGSNYKKLSILMALLLLSNVGTILIDYADYQLMKIESLKLSYVWLLGIAYSLQDATFSVVHFVMAFEYLKIARNIPKAIKRQRYINRRFRRVIFWVLLSCNMLFPLLEAVVLIPYNK